VLLGGGLNETNMKIYVISLLDQCKSKALKDVTESDGRIRINACLLLNVRNLPGSDEYLDDNED
jgi:hypothetical protein